MSTNRTKALLLVMKKRDRNTIDKWVQKWKDNVTVRFVDEVCYAEASVDIFAELPWRLFASGECTPHLDQIWSIKELRFKAKKGVSSFGG